MNAHAQNISCPCCKQMVLSPTVDVLVLNLQIPPMEERILREIWRGGGRSVPAIKIFNSMYADDPDGGPSQSKMYVAFKVQLCRLRSRLKGTGVSIDNAGYGQGYRLVLGEK